MLVEAVDDSPPYRSTYSSQLVKETYWVMVTLLSINWFLLVILFYDWYLITMESKLV